MVGNEENNKKSSTTKLNGLVKNILVNTVEYLANITDLDLSNGKISSFDEDIELPPNIVNLNISYSGLTEVPHKVLKLDKLKTLDVSNNLVVYFNDTPSFCHTIEWFNLSNNKLEGPPLWVWTEYPKKLIYLNLSNNKNMCQTFSDGYFEELLQYKCPVTEIDVHNCNLSKYMKFMSTFSLYAKVVSLGNEDFNYLDVNHLDHVPCVGLEDCKEVEKLNLCNTQLYHVNSNIDIYKNLIEVNLAQNNLNSLPNEFGNLMNLEICILSCNKILYLPDEICKLNKLIKLYLDDNELCMLPENLCGLPSLKIIDLYNNNLYEALDRINNLDEIDFAQNYFEEPNSEEYSVKKEKLRLNCNNRFNGRKPELNHDESEHSPYTSEDDDELIAFITEACEDIKDSEPPDTHSSSPEDWDSDDYWIPHHYKQTTPPRSPWLSFVKKKMAEGNFCPMDAHPVPIAEKVKYEKMCNPPVIYESDGQFDDYSDDNS